VAAGRDTRQFFTYFAPQIIYVMSTLYNSLSEIYEGMYQTFINYEDEFRFYSSILKKHNCRSVLEVGCGTGHLAGSFTRANFDYTGMDLSEEMLSIARKKNTAADFLCADMREFRLDQKTESCIITGRTLSYLIGNKDVLDAFKAIRENMLPQGILSFDFIDALRFIPAIKDSKVVHEATFNGKSYVRDSYWKVNPAQSWTFDWLSVYQLKGQEGTLTEVGRDNSTIRSFTKDEMQLLLTLSGFETLEVIDRPSYAFDTFVFVARSKD
jgi:SAM-dependent methyltransferase